MELERNTCLSIVDNKSVSTIFTLKQLSRDQSQLHYSSQDRESTLPNTTDKSQYHPFQQ